MGHTGAVLLLLHPAVGRENKPLCAARGHEDFQQGHGQGGVWQRQGQRIWLSLEQMLLEQMLLFVRSVAATMELRDMQQRKHEAWYAEHTFVRCLLPQTEENLEECARSVQSEPWGTETDRPLKMPRLSK